MQTPTAMMGIVVRFEMLKALDDAEGMKEKTMAQVPRLSALQAFASLHAERKML